MTVVILIAPSVGALLGLIVLGQSHDIGVRSRSVQYSQAYKRDGMATMAYSIGIAINAFRMGAKTMTIERIAVIVTPSPATAARRTAAASA